MRPTVQWGLIALFAVGSAALGVWLRGEWDARRTPPVPTDVPVLAVGDAIGHWQGKGYDGHSAPLPGDGRWRLVNFWASWCPPCVKELPAFEAYHREQGANGVQVVGIALEDAAPAQAFARRLGLSFPQFAEANSPRDTSVRWGNARGTLPFTVLITPDGRLAATHARPFDDAGDIRDWVDDARQAAPKPNSNSSEHRQTFSESLDSLL
jgi:thiol-disulfide isomerase/thioredoxin